MAMAKYQVSEFKYGPCALGSWYLALAASCFLVGLVRLLDELLSNRAGCSIDLGFRSLRKVLASIIRKAGALPP